MRRCALLGLALLVCVARTAHAQECRHTCRVDETRDANGCCIDVAPPPTRAPDSGGNTASPRPLARHCPAGTSWSEHDRSCVGRLSCPAGAHIEGSGCVADAVACPSGTHTEHGQCVASVACPRDTRLEEGHCIANVTCPPNTRREGASCVSEVHCPDNTHLEQGQCISTDVQCPAGTQRQAGGACVGSPVCAEGTHFTEGRGCVGDTICPTGTNFVEGRGCVGNTACPAGSHLDGAACVPDVVCLEGSHFIEGRGCISVCEGIPHSRWVSDRRACTCEPGFNARDGHCAEITACAPGFHLDTGVCAPDVICPLGYRFLANAGCVDALSNEQVMTPAEREAHQRRQWAEGFAAQFWVQGGYAFIGSGHQGATTADRRWEGFSPSAGLTLSTQNFVFGATYTYVGGGSAIAQSHEQPMNIVALELGVQGASPYYAFRVTLNGGIDLPSAQFAFGMSFRSLFHIVKGLYAGFEVRGIWRLDPLSVSGGVGVYPLTIGYSLY